MVFWVSASLDVSAQDFEASTAFWSAVTGYDASLVPPDGDAYLRVVSSTGPARLRVEPHSGDRVPAVPAPASFAGVRRSRVYQVCLDLPGAVYDAEAKRWVGLTGGRVEVLTRRPEFAWLRIPGGPRPLDLLLQRLDRPDGPVSAHLDIGTPDRPVETDRHVSLGATVLAKEEFWTVLADPTGAPYCITDRDPASGELG